MAAVALAGCGGDDAGSRDGDRPKSVPARVVDVIDGDTIRAAVAGRIERVRYIGIDTPERGRRCFDEATEANARLVRDGFARRFTVPPNVAHAGQFGALERLARRSRRGCAL